MACARSAALTRDVEAWARIAGVSRRALERLMRRHALPAPHAFLASLAADEISRRRARGERWADIAADLQFADDSSLLRFVRTEARRRRAAAAQGAPAQVSRTASDVP